MHSSLPELEGRISRQHEEISRLVEENDDLRAEVARLTGIITRNRASFEALRAEVRDRRKNDPNGVIDEAMRRAGHKRS